MSDPTLDPKTRALVDALLAAVGEMYDDYHAGGPVAKTTLRNHIYDAADALRDHLKPKPLTLGEWTRRFCYDHGASPLNDTMLVNYHRDLKAAIKRGEVVDDE